MGKEIDTPIKSIWHLLFRSLSQSFYLLVVAAFFFSVVLGIGLWRNSEFAVDILVLGVSPKLLLGAITFALAIPLADLTGTFIKLSFSAIKQTYTATKKKPIIKPHSIAVPLTVK